MQEDQNVSANDADTVIEQRKDALNRWMLRLPLNERRSRWAEYLTRLSRIEADAEREFRRKKGPTSPSTQEPISLLQRPLHLPARLDDRSAWMTRHPGGGH